MAGRPKKPNRQLAALIAEAGFSNKGLARRVVDLGQMRGYRDLKYNHSSVERWLRGEQPRPPTPRLLAEVFSAALGRPVALAELGMYYSRGFTVGARSCRVSSCLCQVHGYAE